MKKIEAIIKPSSLDAVKDALLRIGVVSMIIAEVKSFSPHQAEGSLLLRGALYQLDFLPRLKLEILSTDEQSKEIVEALEHTLRAGRPNDERIIVTTPEEVLHIRSKP